MQKPSPIFVSMQITVSPAGRIWMESQAGPGVSSYSQSGMVCTPKIRTVEEEIRKIRHHLRAQLDEFYPGRPVRMDVKIQDERIKQADLSSWGAA